MTNTVSFAARNSQIMKPMTNRKPNTGNSISNNSSVNNSPVSQAFPRPLFAGLLNKKPAKTEDPTSGTGQKSPDKKPEGGYQLRLEGSGFHRLSVYGATDQAKPYDLSRIIVSKAQIGSSSMGIHGSAEDDAVGHTTGNFTTPDFASNLSISSIHHTNGKILGDQICIGEEAQLDEVEGNTSVSIPESSKTVTINSLKAHDINAYNSLATVKKLTGSYVTLVAGKFDEVIITGNQRVLSESPMINGVLFLSPKDADSIPEIGSVHFEKPGYIVVDTKLIKDLNLSDCPHLAEQGVKIVSTEQWEKITAPKS